MQIFAFGDSITYGAWDEHGGWADRLRRFLNAHFLSNSDSAVLFYNLGVPGQTSSDLKRRFLFETEARLGPQKEPAVFIFAFGTNDAALIPSLNRHRVAPETYQANMNWALSEARQRSDAIFCLTAPPVIEALALAPPNKDRSRCNATIREYNRLLQEQAARARTTVIDVYGEFEKRGAADLFVADGIHPNAAGHELISSLVRDALMKLIAPKPKRSQTA